jgi:hypothetical protein
MNSTAKTDRLTRAAARNPAAWSVARLGPVLFGATCEASGDRFEVVSAYNRIFFVENMAKGTTYRCDDTGCECADFQQRQAAFNTCCKHRAACIQVRRFVQSERMVDAPMTTERVRATERFLSEVMG